MNRLSREKRATILHLLVEGTSLRATARLTKTSINTVTRLLVEAGDACAAYHDQAVRHVKSKRVQVDEIWTFTYAKDKNVPMAKAAPEGAGDTWTWTALDADSKLIISWLMGPRDAGSAYTMMHDLADRLATRVQLTSDGLRLYVGAVEDAFGADIDYSQLIKLYGAPQEPETRYSPATCHGIIEKRVTGCPDPKHVSTSYVERQNLNIRMGIRRFTRLTNAFGKKLENQVHAFSLYLVYYNFCRIHTSLRMSPAMAAGVSDTLRDMEWIVDLIDARTPAPKKPGPAVGTKYQPRKSD